MKKNPFIFDFEPDQSQFSKGPLEWEESAVDSLSSVEGFAQEQLVFYARWLNVLLFGVFFALGFKMFYLQVAQGDYYREFAEQNRLRKQTVLAPRGLIKDRHSEILARNTASLNLVAVPFDINRDGLDKQLAELSKVVSFDIQVVKAKILNADPASLDPVVVKQDLALEESLLFETRTSDFLGFSLQKLPVREYMNPESLFHILGYAGLISSEEFAQSDKSVYSGFDFIGKAGIEQMYEHYIHGRNGSTQIEVDAKGNLIGKLGSQEPESGNTLILNIDKGLQTELYKLLKGSGGKRRAAAVALNPKNGEVLALISLPGLDGAKFMRGFQGQEFTNILEDPALPLFNRVVSGTYPPGSTVKPVVAAAALEEKIIDENTVYNDKGVLVIPHRFDPRIDYNFYGWKRDGLGKVNVIQAIAKSSDIFFYIVSGGLERLNLPGLGIEKLAEYYRRFNLGKPTGVDLPSEAHGLVPDPAWKKERFKGDPTLAKWYLGDTYHVGIGQGDVLTTPLQVALWTATIANRGVGYQPQILKRVLKGDSSEEVIFEQKPQVIISSFIDLKNIRLVQEGMRETVVNGSGRALNTLAISSAGKTGTSQFDGSDPKKTHAWFTAYAPFEDPSIVITVLIEAGGEGSSVAVPVVRDALKWWAENRYSK
ncbi:MAG: penicillin-binding protein 2 [Candidatus Doudnabacteria bacterium]|nr:penicillin-binding protein 2 [Candidatus Doudnabacteria bacterium]